MRSRLPRSWSPSNGYEQAAFITKRRRPADLGEPGLDRPIIHVGGEQLARFLTHKQAGICPEIFDAIYGKPVTYFRSGVAMFLRMTILVANPGLLSSRFTSAIPQHRVERDPSVSRKPREYAPQPQRHACKGIVKAKDNYASRAQKRQERFERSARIARVMQDARRVNDIECVSAQSGTVEIGFDELNPRDAKAFGGSSADLQRRAGKVRPDHDPVRACKVEAHLPCTATDLKNSCVRRNRSIKQPRKLA